MAIVDFSKLRDQTLGSGQDEEAVTVNTRALIDKVLARYSGEHTTIRELIQNAADASATNVTIKFETLPSPTVPLPSSNDRSANLKHTVRHHTLQRLLVSNNGEPFRESDWARLKRIAEGNPDETKIGAFGVGFYSVFSECENPFVISGDQSMAFYWKGNSLFTRRGRLPPESLKDLTSFVLDYRNKTTAVPDLMSICQFLSTSLTFVNLESIDLWLDDWKVFSLKKKFAPEESIDMPRGVNTKTKEGILQVTGITSQSAQIDASWMNIVGWTPAAEQIDAQAGDTDGKPPSLRTFFSRLTGSGKNSVAAKKAAAEEAAAQKAISEDITGSSQATVFIRINNVSAKSRVSGTFSAELERATKKPPPKTTKIQILTSSHDETEATMSTVSGAASSKVAGAILGALPTKNGKIFIGFPTAQTTGLLAHISAPSLIPTVERENVDLNARYVRTWNQELLGVAGVACRIAYASEMGRLRLRLNATAKDNNGLPTDSEVEKSLPTAIHTLEQFTFNESTPLSGVSRIVEEAFWTCMKAHSIEMISSCGVLSSEDVRIASESLSFVKGLPVVPELVQNQAADFLAKLSHFGFLSEITTADIKRELEKQALSEAQLEELLKWAAKGIRCDQLEIDSVQALFSSTVVTLAPDASGSSQGLIELRRVHNFLNPSRISPDLPLPPETIPQRFTKGIVKADLESFGWEELQLVPWLRWLLQSASKGSLESERNPLQTPAFAQQMLSTVSRGWDNLSQSSKNTVVELLSPLTVIPTKHGMRKPSEAYFPSVRLFDDLPITKLDGVKERFLKTLGVRKTIELSVIFSRLMSTSDSQAEKSSWSHIDLIKYLVSVWDDIPEADLNQLRNTALCPAEVDGDPKKATKQRFKLAELYEPKDSLRQLGLPVAQWPPPFNAFSSEGKFLRTLGLRLYPSVPELIKIVADAHTNGDISVFEAGLRYFIENHYQNNYASFDLSGVQLRFLPVEGMEKRTVASPIELFASANATKLGFQVIRADLRSNASKLGVREHPPIFDCATRLTQKPPSNEKEAKSLFAYFAERLTEISPNLADRLSAMPIVPVKSKHHDGQAPTYRMVNPSSCFLGDNEEYGDIFDYVDFGQEANVFLLKVGSKHEPSITELARHLMREPAQRLQSLKTEKYLNLLRRLQVNASTLKKDKVLWKEMRKAPFLLAYRERPAQGSEQDTQNLMDLDDLEAEEQPLVREWHLRAAEHIVIVTDLIPYALFREHLAAAPQEEPLEDFYRMLGAPTVADLVDEEPRLGPGMRDQRSADVLKELILERSRLFLHEQPSNAVVHDVRWLEKNLAVQTVQSVSLRRSLKGYNKSHTERRTAAVVLSRDGKTKFTLAITPEYDVWQVSQEIVGLLVGKSKTQNIFVFEMFLSTSLYKLKSRGYDVDRVLKRKQREARAAELEKQRQVEEDRKRVQQRQEEMALVDRARPSKLQDSHPDETFHDADDSAQSSNDKIAMPGAFDNSPDRTQQQQRQPQPSSLFSQVRKGLGLDQNQSFAEGLENFMRRGGGPRPLSTTPQAAQSPTSMDPSGGLPPPYTPYDPQALQTQGQPSAEHVSPPANTNSNLQSAISASRGYNSSQLFTQLETNSVKEVASYCDTRSGHNLVLVAQTSQGMQMYLDRTVPDPTSFVERNHPGLDLFAATLLECAAVFDLRKESLHIYFDTQGESIAFNSNGAIFCNFRYFAQLHLPGLTKPETVAQAESAALIYWWVTICHELAHNIVSDHSSNHSYYTEHFVMEFFPTVANRAMQRAAAAMRGQRGRGVPLQYLLGTEFFGDFELRVRRGVLIPRQETAAAVTYLAKRLPSCLPDKFSKGRLANAKVQPSLKILDLCTGTGCMGLLLAYELSKTQQDVHLQVLGVDISNQAVRLARKNATRVQRVHKFMKRHTIDFFQADVLAASERVTGITPSLWQLLEQRGETHWDVVVANPPYVSVDDYFSSRTERSVRCFEPRRALLPPPSFSNGLLRDSRPEDLFYDKLVSAMKKVQAQAALLEIGSMDQAQRVARSIASDIQSHDAKKHRVETWRDDPGAFDHSIISAPSDRLPVVGNGAVRSIFVCRHDA
ncbi:MAG: hypothetical protein Q9159_003172 [Coniocarpon cinnabarinum]